MARAGRVASGVGAITVGGEKQWPFLRFRPYGGERPAKVLQCAPVRGLAQVCLLAVSAVDLIAQ